MSVRGGRTSAGNKRKHKRALYALQDGVCPLCGSKMPFNMRGHRSTPVDPDVPTLDHIRRKRDGGLWARTNLQLVHGKCNEGRG